MLFSELTSSKYIGSGVYGSIVLHAPVTTRQPMRDAVVLLEVTGRTVEGAQDWALGVAGLQVGAAVGPALLRGHRVALRLANLRHPTREMFGV